MVFLHRLAERLGKTVGELMHVMSAQEFSRWLALAELEQEAREAAEGPKDSNPRNELISMFQTEASK